MGPVHPVNPAYDAAKAKANNAVGNIIRKERKKLNLTAAELADLLKNYGVDVQTSAILKWESGVNVPSAYQLFALCHALDIQGGLSAFTGQVELGTLNPEGQRLLNLYHDFLVSTGNYEPVKRTHHAKVKMRVYTIPVSAGYGSWLDSNDYETLSVSKQSVPMGTDFGVYVQGHSMEPLYHDGQIAWVRKCETLNTGDIGIFFYDGSSYIKEYTEEEPDEDDLRVYGYIRQKIVLHSLNPDYPDIPVECDDFRIFGRVLN